MENFYNDEKNNYQEEHDVDDASAIAFRDLQPHMLKMLKIVDAYFHKG